MVSFSVFPRSHLFALVALFGAASPVVATSVAMPGAAGEKMPVIEKWTFFRDDTECKMQIGLPSETGQLETGVVISRDDIRGQASLTIINSSFGDFTPQQYTPMDVALLKNGVVWRSYLKSDFFPHKTAYGPSVFTLFMADFIEEMEQSDAIGVVRGDKVELALTLMDAKVALVALKQCAAKLALERSDAKYDAKSVAQQAEAIAPETWFNSADYPAESRRLGQEGTVAFDLDVDPIGLAGKCKITSSSGHSLLDKYTCVLAIRRARFEGAKTAAGSEAWGRYQGRFKWVLKD